MRRERFSHVALIALCLSAPAFAYTSSGVDDAASPGIDNPGLDVTRHAMPPPDVTAKPAEAPTVAANSPSVTAPELTAVGNTGTFSDVDDAVTITASTGSVSQVGSQSGTWSWTGTAPDESAPYTVTITATNADGSTATATFDVSFTDAAPTVAADNASVSAAENAATFPPTRSGSCWNAAIEEGLRGGQ